MNLYTITENYKNLLENMQIDEETGELLNAAEFEIAETEFSEKAEAYALYIKDLTAHRDAIKEECRALQLRGQAVDNLIDKLSDRLIEGMQKIGKTKHETVKTEFFLKKSIATKIFDETNLTGIPEDYIKTKTTRTADKTAIKKAIQSGEKVEGAELVTNINLQIK